MGLKDIPYLEDSLRYSPARDENQENYRRCLTNILGINSRLLVRFAHLPSKKNSENAWYVTIPPEHRFVVLLSYVHIIG